MSTLLWFIGASMLLTVAPGPDNVFVVTQGIARGRRVAIVTALGMCSGVSVHTIAAAAGISIIFYSSAIAFSLVKYLGALYLMFLAYKAVREGGALLRGEAAENADLWAMYRRGFLMNVLNPKVALFFLAFLPQFTNRDLGPIALQMIALGLIFALQAAVIFSAIGYFSGTVGNYILSRPRVANAFAWVSAGIFAALGLRLALAHRV